MSEQYEVTKFTIESIHDEDCSRDCGSRHSLCESYDQTVVNQEEWTSTDSLEHILWGYQDIDLAKTGEDAYAEDENQITLYHYVN